MRLKVGQFVILIFVIISWIHGYRYTILPFDLLSPCIPEKRCGPNIKTHTLCITIKSQTCVNFIPMKMPLIIKQQSLSGINGIRNRMASNLNIANMNLLVKHWSRLLTMMAKRFLLNCEIKRDICDFVVNASYSVGQTFIFTDSPPHAGGWHVAPIREWYTEIAGEDGSPQINSVDDWKKLHSKFPNFTQLIWPTVEFVGCAAARMNKGYLTTCYFHPRANLSAFDNDVIRGVPCSECHEERPTCSRNFIKLCGLDLDVKEDEDDYSSGMTFRSTKVWILLCLSVLIYLKLNAFNIN